MEKSGGGFGESRGRKSGSCPRGRGGSHLGVKWNEKKSTGFYKEEIMQKLWKLWALERSVKKVGRIICLNVIEFECEEERRRAAGFRDRA